MTPHAATRTASAPVVDTPYGRLRGASVAGVARFLGVPYAQAPVGDRRLRSPRQPETWAGERDATAPGAASLQTLAGPQTWLYEPITRTDEDCLFLNVWTPDTGARLPVIVWLHGGATRNGHGAAGAFDGAALASLGRVVVVTINYRLGALGGLAHPDLRDDDTGHCANWGLQDKLAALAWARECIAAFGGDPGRIILAGQSSGAANAVMIAQGPAARGRVAGLIAQSPPLFRPPMFAELADAADYTERLARELAVAVPALRAIDGMALQRAEQAFIRGGASPRPRTAPVRDGALIREWPYTGEAVAVPMLIGSTRDEALFWYGLRDADGKVLSPSTPPQTREDLEAQVARLMRLHHPFDPAPAPAEAVALYEDARRVTTPARCAETWSAIYTDLVFRAPIFHCAARHASRGHPAFVYEFAHALPAPGAGTPHAADVPFVFGTTGSPHLARKVGHGPGALATANATMRMWASFAWTGDPTGDRSWPRFSAERRDVMTIGADAGTAAPAPARRDSQLACWAAFRGGAA
ncbi:MAG TPA: carboxylesterase family protein [Burkholderiales bacterium]|nr:carboxylesterase family protein [Burkholderiales bacterium]